MEVHKCRTLQTGLRHYVARRFAPQKIPRSEKKIPVGKKNPVEKKSSGEKKIGGKKNPVKKKKPVELKFGMSH
jgi:hypothetical protein